MRSTRKVQYIACINEATFVMHFAIQAFSIDDGKFLDNLYGFSGDCPIDQTRVLDMATLGLPDNDILVRPWVFAIGGAQNQCQQMVGFDTNARTATFSVCGTPLDYTITPIDFDN